jgi:hypothetical protein
VNRIHAVILDRLNIDVKGLANRIGSLAIIGESRHALKTLPQANASREGSLFIFDSAV